MAEHLTEDDLAALALTPEDTPRLPAVQHLEACEECRARVASVQRAMRAADAWAEAPARESAEALHAVRARLDAELGLSGAPPQPARGVVTSVTNAIDWVRLFVPALAAALLAFVLGKGGGHAPALGLECAVIELGAAAVLAGGGYLVVRHRLQSLAAGSAVRERAPFLLASVAGSGALLAQLWLHEHCPAEPASAHAFISHAGAVLLAIAIALIVSRRLMNTAIAR